MQAPSAQSKESIFNIIFITADRDARRSDGSNKYKGVGQQYITKY